MWRDLLENRGLKSLSANVRECLRTSAKVCENPRKSDYGNSNRGNSRFFTDFRGITDDFHNLHLFRFIQIQSDLVGFAFSQIFTSPRKSAAGLFADFRGHSKTNANRKKSTSVSRTFADFRGQFQSAIGLWRTFADIRGLSWTFAEGDFSRKEIRAKRSWRRESLA